MLELARKHKKTALIIIIAIALLLRLWGLGSLGFNDDEINKLEAAQSYLQGNLKVNLEHPMLMKSLAAVSLSAAKFWNHFWGELYRITDEVAVRMPNVIFGSLTSVVIFLFALQCFGFEAALASAFLWAVGIIPITVNRLAKEDTLLVFFAWLAYYLYLKAKQPDSILGRMQQKYYAASGASFGLMLASKYFPHYLGLNFVYYWLRGDKREFPPRRRIDTLLLFSLGVLVFLVVNPVILQPGTWQHFFHYVQKETITHHGYLMMGQFDSQEVVLRGGMPGYFYILFFLIKTPLPILGFFAVGLVEIWRRRKEAGASFVIFMFLCWIIPFSLIGGKWLRYMLSWMPTVTMIAGIGMIKLFDALRGLLKDRIKPRSVALISSAVILLLCIIPVYTALKAAPFYSLYLNPLGMNRVGYYFPNEELNDIGLREAILQVCKEAPKGASIAGETPQVFKYYIHNFGRDDLHYVQLSAHPQLTHTIQPMYIVVQDGRKYLENIALIRKIESSDRPIHSINFGGICAVRVYHAQQVAQLRWPR